MFALCVCVFFFLCCPRWPRQRKRLNYKVTRLHFACDINARTRWRKSHPHTYAASITTKRRYASSCVIKTAIYLLPIFTRVKRTRASHTHLRAKCNNGSIIINVYHPHSVRTHTPIAMHCNIIEAMMPHHESSARSQPHRL